MEKKKPVTVYRCPFCQDEVWFNKKTELARHFWIQHIREVMDEYARQQKTVVKESLKKWNITT